MVGDVWSDGLTVYYCCHLVTRQSKVSGQWRPDPCCGVTTCDCSQARLSPLAPNLLLMRGGQQTQGRESQLASVRGSTLNVHQRLKKCFPLGAGPTGRIRQTEWALSPLNLVGRWFESVLRWLNMHFVDWGCEQKMLVGW